MSRPRVGAATWVVSGTTVAAAAGLLSNFSEMPTPFQAICVGLAVPLTLTLAIAESRGQAAIKKVRPCMFIVQLHGFITRSA